MKELRNLPNIISALRLGAVPLLAWLAWMGADRSFAWLLVIVGPTDMLDGWLARKYGWESRLGAMLDSVADFSIVIVVLFAIVTMHQEVFASYGRIVWAIVGIWSLTNILGLIRYRRLPSFHTAFGRIGLMTFGVFVLVLFFYGLVPWVLYVCGTICFLAGVESFILVLLLDQWTPNLRGGLPAVIRARQKPPGDAV